MIALLKASRPLNLLIVGLTQFLFYYIFFLDENRSFDLLLSERLLSSFIIVTMLIAACGYYINDYFDHQSDQSNEKNNKLSRRGSYLISYFTFFLIGWFLSIWVAWEINKLPLSIIYLVATGLLFIYSSHLKRMPIIGNIVVAIFSVFVLGIILYAESVTVLHSKWRDLVLEGYVLQVTFFYILFIFILSFKRELIKDIEDIDGDMLLDYRTYPIVTSKQSAKNLSLILNIILFLVSSFWLYYSWHFFSIYVNVYFTVGILLPTCLIGFLILKATVKKDYSRISSVCKILMFLGLIYIIVLAWV